MKTQRSTKPKPPSSKPLVGIIMGSSSDAETMTGAKEILNDFGVPYEFKVVSAHRTPDAMFKYAEQAYGRGLEVIIAGAGGAAHLPGMVAAKTILPVIGVPMPTKELNGIDSLLSIAQMPKGIPVATVAIGNSANAGLLALRILGIKYPAISKQLADFQSSLIDQVRQMNIGLEK